MFNRWFLHLLFSLVLFAVLHVILFDDTFAVYNVPKWSTLNLHTYTNNLKENHRLFIVYYYKYIPREIATKFLKDNHFYYFLYATVLIYGYNLYECERLQDVSINF